MARGLEDVLDTFIDGPRPLPKNPARQTLRVPLGAGERVAAALVAAVAAQLPRLGVSVALELLDPGARSLVRTRPDAGAAPAELTFEIETARATPRAQAVLLILPDLAAAARLGFAFGFDGPARETLVLDCAPSRSESAAIRWLVQRSGAFWIASITPLTALRAALAENVSGPAAARAAHALKNWLRASHP